MTHEPTLARGQALHFHDDVGDDWQAITAITGIFMDVEQLSFGQVGPVITVMCETLRTKSRLIFQHPCMNLVFFWPEFQ